MLNSKRTHFFRSLVANIALTMVLLSVVILVVVTSFDVYIAIIGQQKTVASQQYQMAENAAQTVRGFIEDKTSDLEHTLIHLSFEIPFENLSPKELQSLFAGILKHQPAFRNVAYLERAGTKKSYESPEHHGPFALSAAERAVLLDATDEGKTYIGPLHLDETTEEPYMIIAVPVRNASNAITGALAAELKLVFMWDVLKEINTRLHGQIYLVNRQGVLVASANESAVRAQKNLSALSTVSRFRSGDTDPTTATEISEGISGERVVSTYVPLVKPDWSVIVESPVREAYADIIFLLKMTVVLIFASLAITAVGAYYLARRVTRPLAEVRDAAIKIGAGKLDTRMDTNLPNEIADLAEVLNKMAESLQNSYQSLAGKVREKTAELSAQIEETSKAKLAVLNLLEDVEEEKARVEQTVVERTQELNDEKARLLASINSLPFGFIIADKEGTILLKNPMLGTILGSGPEVSTLTQVNELLKSVDVAQTCKQCETSGGISEHKEVPYGKKFLHVSCAQILEGSHVIGNVILIEDITEARVMDRSRDEFFSIASHELRTPLTAIRGNADMILEMYADKIPDKDMKDMLVDINASSVRLIDIVNDFLEVSRLEQGKIEVKKENFDLSEVIEKTMRDLKPAADRSGLSLTYTPPTTPLPQVYADKRHVVQILVNLIGNAVKFTKQGSISVEVNIQGGLARILVKDTGIGIAEKNQALLFRKFQQAGEQILARDVTQGTGLGLYICNLLATGMGGAVGLEKSEVGKGSSFFFTVPLAQVTIIQQS